MLISGRGGCGVRQSNGWKVHWLDLVPEELLQGHEDGKVVFFCGAGVSMPAGLPDFKGLVKNVLTEMLPSKSNCQPGTSAWLAWRAFCKDRYDEALDILENPREDGYEPKQVRKEVRNQLEQQTGPLDKHLILARLADLDDKERGRLVTTNFDPLFEEAAKELCEQGSYRPDVHVAPNLPPAKQQTFRGLTYLHGKLGSSPDDLQLVLTESDFSRAYLLEGWARRFAVDLFRHYHVVFIGYRVEDPMMRSLVRTLDVVREESPQQFKQPYAFAKKGTKVTVDERKWRLKGIEPLLYDAADKPDEHQELWRVLGEWADDYRQGRTERREKVARLGQHPPKDKNDIQYMAWRLKDIEIARRFADSKAHHGWIAPLQEMGLLSLPIGQITDKGEDIAVPLVSQRLTDHLAPHDATLHLSRWIVECLNTQEALDWALRGGCVLHTNLRWQIRLRLDDEKAKIKLALRKIWQVLADDSYAHALSEKSLDTLSIPRLAPDAIFAKWVFLNRLRPIPIFTGSANIKVELIGIRCRSEDVKSFRDRAEDWEGVLASVADELTTLLLAAMDWFCEFDLAARDWDLSHSRYPSIREHEQNQYAPTWTQLIALTRESYDALVAAGNQDAAACLVRRWLSLPYPVFRRLALYATAGGRNA